MGIKAWLISKLERDVEIEGNRSDWRMKLLNTLKGTKQLPEGEEKIKIEGNDGEKFREGLRVTEKKEIHDKHMRINKMITYGFAGKCVHLHLPIDLKEDLHTLGLRLTVDKVNLYLIDAIEKINEKKIDKVKNFKNKNSIYMISPVLIPSELEMLEEFGFTTKFYAKGVLSNNRLIEGDREAILATKIFGTQRNIGTANLEFKDIDTDKFKQAKAKLVERCNKAGITIEEPEEDKER